MLLSFFLKMRENYEKNDMEGNILKMYVRASPNHIPFLGRNFWGENSEKFLSIFLFSPQNTREHN